MESPLYGFYSYEASKIHITNIYTDITGKHVLVTNVSLDINANDYFFNDKKFVGQVVDFVKIFDSPSSSAERHF